MKTVFIIGSKSIGNYGGFETFVDKLVKYFENDNDFQFYVACKKNGQGSMDPSNTEGACIVSDNEFVYHGAICFQIKIPEFLGPAQAVYYDLKAIRMAIDIVKKYDIKDFIIYILACRVGPFFKGIASEIHRLGGKVMINPDGHEWLRSKWNSMIKRYWKLSEKMMVKNADLIICDSLRIEDYIHKEYQVNNTKYIAYPEDLRLSIIDDESWTRFIHKHNISNKNYYLVIGRFVPENNYDTIINEFMKSNTNKDLVIVCNENKKLYVELLYKYDFTKDKRIKFIGPVYNSELLRKIREEAYCYIHGHEVGGTNPSLLEALSSTSINILYDVNFNREVAKDSALYWTKEPGSLSCLIDYCDKMDPNSIESMRKKANNRIAENYSSESIFSRYRNTLK